MPARLPVALALLTVTLTGAIVAQEPEKKQPLAARLDVKTHEHSYTVRFYLKNTSDQEVVVTTGRGNAGRSVVPMFYVLNYHVNPPVYLSPPRRALRPQLLKIASGQEVLYGTYTMGYPPSEKERKDVEIFGQISFPDAKLLLRTAPQKMTVPKLDVPN